jgi:hypothetical protein
MMMMMTTAVVGYWWWHLEWSGDERIHKSGVAAIQRYDDVKCITMDVKLYSAGHYAFHAHMRV